MLTNIKYLTAIASIVLTIISSVNVRAQTAYHPGLESNAFELINAVNALRASYGLAPYNINPILMFTAQNQADFMAANGIVTHSGPGGSTLTQRLLAAGYPLGGDLSLGGFRAENIIAGSMDMTGQDAVQAWMGDAPHQNTMLSPNLTEIGAGVAIANGQVYYVIDCARPSDSGAPPAATTIVGSGSAVPASEAAVFPVVVSTPDSFGDVIHEVQFGHSLWQIAIAYGVKIDDIKRLNNMTGNDIFPGDKLLIKKNIFPTTLPPTETTTPEPSITAAPSFTETPTRIPIATSTSVITNVGADQPIAVGVIIIVVLAVLGGGAFAWLGSRKEKNNVG